MTTKARKQATFRGKDLTVYVHPCNDSHMNTATATVQTVAKCSKGHFVRGTWDDAGRNGGWLICGCGARGIAKGFHVTIKDTHCGARCTSALGPVCDCTCGGEAHGEDHRF